MRLNAFLTLFATVLITSALFELHAASNGVDVTPVSVGEIPATVFRPQGAGVRPVVVIAHGFAGSQQLMQSFALTFARNGYIALTFDFPGHGRNPQPLTGSITDANGATRALIGALARVVTYARGLGDGRLALLGHSMATDVVIRYAQETPDVNATIAVSMFSPAVTATGPRDLLVIVGDWESALKREALRTVGFVTAAPRAGVTYGSPAAGTGRRAAFSPRVEHVSVLYSEASMREALTWLDAVWGTRRLVPPHLDARGPWILALLCGVVLLARPLATLLPRVAAAPAGAGRGWRAAWLPLVLPAIVTPLLLRVVPTHFLPVLVGDYLAAHFAVYGALTLLCMRLTRARETGPTREITAASAATSAAAVGAGAVAVLVYAGIAIAWPIDHFVTAFFPGPQRLVLVGAMLAGTSLFFLSDEWLTRGVGAARGAYAVSKILFVLSLGAAVALDPYRLFFLIIIVPIIVAFLVIFGAWSRWIYRACWHPFVAGSANAVIFAWAIAATFPLMAG